MNTQFVCTTFDFISGGSIAGENNKEKKAFIIQGNHGASRNT